MDEFDFQEFAGQVQQAAAALLRGKPAEEDVVQCARVVQEMAEVHLARHRGDPSLIACGPGCGHCCALNVAVLMPEALAIVDYLVKHLSAEDLTALKLRLASLAERIRGLGDDERRLAGERCALLDAAQNCLIYPVRPLLCRGVNSTDPDRCRAAMQSEAAPVVLANLFQIRLMDHAFLGLARALEEGGIEAESRRLSDALLDLLGDPAARKDSLQASATLPFPSPP